MNCRACIRGVMNIKKAKEVCQDRRQWHSIVSANVLLGYDRLLFINVSMSFNRNQYASDNRNIIAI